MGIAPWTADPSRKEQNFLWQLKQAGMIDHMTVSFFVHLDDARFPKSPSTVKFGSWDVRSTTGALTMIRTASKTAWDIRANLFKFDKDDEGLKLSSLIRIDPGLPYLYFPDAIYT